MTDFGNEDGLGWNDRANISGSSLCDEKDKSVDRSRFLFRGALSIQGLGYMAFR